MADNAGETPSDKILDEATEEAPPKKGGAMRMIMMILLPLALAGAGFYVTYSGMFGSSEPVAEAEPAEKPAPALAPDIAYMELDELVVPLAPSARSNVLIFQASLEVPGDQIAEIEKLRPRLLDVLNTYLRVVDHETLQEPSAMPLLRARLLRRFRTVAAPIEPRDILITTFVFK